MDPAKAVGLANTVKPTVLPPETVLLHPAGIPIETIVTVVEPALDSEGVVNAPEPRLKIIGAVAFVAVLLPLRLKVTVYVPVVKVLELTVTVDEDPIQVLVADGVEKLLRSIAHFSAITKNPSVITRFF